MALLEQTERKIFTCVGGRYFIWKDDQRWRWALRHWPDDDLGFSNHGAVATAKGAVARCAEHFKERALIFEESKL
jgi:hypothetical protein